jgi:hypothetical protein
VARRHNLGFPGQYYDQETGLICNLRFPGQLYMPETGLNYNYCATSIRPRVGMWSQIQSASIAA